MTYTIDPTDQADSNSYFENMARAQYRDRMEQDAESRYEEFAEYEPSEATEWADYDPDC
jgi:hypothetical protein